MTGRDFTELIRARAAYRGRVRALTAFLADPAVPALVDHALAGAGEAAGAGCRAPAVTLSPDRRRVAVLIAGHGPRAAVFPWREAGREMNDWTWTADAAALTPAAPDRPSLPLVVGADRLTGGTVVADWTAGPPAVSLEGDTRVARSVLQALAAQLDLFPGGPAVEVARGVHPHYPGRELDVILDDLRAAAAYGPGGGTAAYGSGGEAAGPPVVLVCWAPTGDQRRRLADLCAGGRVRALIGGEPAGKCWRLHAEPSGRLLGPDPGIDVEAAALSTAVSTAIKGFHRGATGWWVPRAEPAVPSGGGAVADGRYETGRTRPVPPVLPRRATRLEPRAEPERTTGPRRPSEPAAGPDAGEFDAFAPRTPAR
ncbi:hypothetical protein [Streptomyces sp. CAU 1734]|uniref:hypothetical protein n=1 Tax=Streptomyces sp. CAU 1734 TaxID=3140360 RepID=UPI003260D909